jgi:hypothetical protein
MHQILIFILERKSTFSDSSSVHRQDFFTVHTAMVHVVNFLPTACNQDPDPACKLPEKSVWPNTAVCTVKNSW